MSSLVFRTTARLVAAFMVLVAAFLMLRGHDQPGGGFAAGLTASGAFTLYALADEPRMARRALRVEPRALLGAGLLLVLASGSLAWLSGQPFFTARWLGTLHLGGGFEVSIGTPLLFDVGILLAVTGATLSIVLEFMEG